jgi:hypothetical protein
MSQVEEVAAVTAGEGSSLTSNGKEVKTQVPAVRPKLVAAPSVVAEHDPSRSKLDRAPPVAGMATAKLAPTGGSTLSASDAASSPAAFGGGDSSIAEAFAKAEASAVQVELPHEQPATERMGQLSVSEDEGELVTRSTRIGAKTTALLN